jgi:Tfp pilus assembly protein PilV
VVKKRSGITVAEVIVAMTLLAVAALGVAATALVALQSFTAAELQERALREAETVLDSLVRLPANGAGARSIGAARVGWPAADSAALVTVHIFWGNRRLGTLAGAR